MSLKQQISSGILWSTYARLGQQIVQFGLSIFLVRLLLPQDFGLIAMVAVFTGFAGLFADGGFSSALIQKEEIEEEHIHSIFWLNLVAGAALFLLMSLAAPWIARFYNEPLLDSMTRVLALSFIIVGVGMVPATLMQRRMQFEKLAKISIISTVLSGVFGVALAYAGWGVWSLVAQNLSAVAIGTSLNWTMSGWRPRLMFSYEALRELWKFTVGLFGFSFINYWARNADNLLIGKAFGSSALGVYSRAYFFMLLPITQIIGVVSQVMFPALSSIQNDKERVKRIYLRAMSVISLITFPIMIGLLVGAKPFILTLYGERWAAVIPLLQILAIVGMMQSLYNPVGWIYTSQGRTDLLFWWGVFGAGTLVVALLIGVMLGSTKTVALCYAAANAVLFYPCLAIPGKLINMSVVNVVMVIAGPLLGSLIMGVALLLLLLMLPDSWLPWQQLLMLVVSGTGIYTALMIALRVPAWEELSDFVCERWLARRAKAAMGGTL